MHNPAKKTLFSLAERIELLETCLADCDNVEVAAYDGLLVDYAEQRQAHAILRGMRAVSDLNTNFSWP